MLTMRFLRTATLLSVFAVLLGSLAPAQAQSKPRTSSRSTRKVVVKVDSQPPGANVYVDNRDAGPAGTTPASLRITTGKHKLILEREGYQTTEKDIRVDRSQSLVFTLEPKVAPAILDLRAGSDGSASGAAITVDGTPVGNVPNRVEVSAGSHLVEVKRPDYLDWRDTLKLGEGEVRTVVVVLSPARKSGSILVTADLPDADVIVDGQPRDKAPTVVSGLSEGGHTVEVRKEGYQNFQQFVNVKAGEQAKVFASLKPPTPIVGQLKVLSFTPGAQVFVDGDLKGPAPVEVKDLKPGAHIVDVRAPGHDPRQVDVQIAANELRVVQVDLVRQAARPTTGTIRVIGPLPEVDVFLDGAYLGRAPIEKKDIPAGKHFVLLRKSGYAEERREITVEADAVAEVIADLRAVASLRVISNLPGAAVLIDGSPAGRTPAVIEGVSTGTHLVEVQAPGYQPAQRNVEAQGGQRAEVSLDLQPLPPSGPTAADIALQRREQSSFGATVLDRGHFNLDIGSGYPYYISARAIGGIYKAPSGIGVDLGVELRSTLHETDVGIRPRVQFLRTEFIAVGLDATLLGGGGLGRRNSLTFEVGPTVTLLAGRWVRFTVKPYYGYYNDRLCPSVGQIRGDDGETGQGTPGSGELYASERTACKNFDGRRPSDYLPAGAPGTPVPRLSSDIDPRERFITHRFLLQGVVEILLRDFISVWVLVEGAPGQGERQAFTSKFNRFFSPRDFPIYARAGVTFKF